MTLSALIFDVDGTLADTEEAHRQAFNLAFAEAGYDWNWERQLYTQLLSVTGGKARIRYFLEQHHPQLLASNGIDELIADLHRRKTAFYVEAMQQGRVPLRPGVERLLHQARDEGLTLAIATTTTPVNFQSLIESTLGSRALDWFAVIGAGDCVENLKPAPDIYLWVLDRLNLDAGRCLALEDSANGLKAAAAANIPALITYCPYTKDHDFSGALEVRESLDEPDRVDVNLLRALHGRL